MSTNEKYDYKFDLVASKNLADIFDYIRYNLCNPKAAQDLYSEIVRTIEQIRAFPESGETRYEDIRRVLTKNYWLYYIPMHEVKTIYIVKITHTKQKYENENFN